MSSDSIESGFSHNGDMMRKVIQNNLLCHKDIVDSFSKEVTSFLSGRDLSQELDVLDIGLGDGWVPFTLFSSLRKEQSLPVTVHLTALDSSSKAITKAKANFELLEFVRFDGVEQGMTEYMSNCGERSQDLIISTHAIHHVVKEEQKQVVEGIYRALKPGGIFLWGDAHNQFPGEPREKTLQSWIQRLGSSGVFSEEERQHMSHHSGHGYMPEPLEDILEMIRSAGFDAARTKICFDDGINIVVIKAEKE